MMKYLLALMLALATCWAGNPLLANIAPESIQEVSGDYKLPNNVVPTDYIIELKPYLDSNNDKNFTFDGKSTISLNVISNTKTITFHAKQLKFDKKDIKLTYTYENKTNQNNTILYYTKNQQKDFVILTLEQEINSTMQDVKLSISYSGVLNDGLRGFYKSSYQNGDKTRWLATTHFEPVGARQAFPCWDEPAIKATFKIIIDTSELSEDYDVVSNMRVDNKNNKKTTFLKTPVMSTYLVAFVVSDYERKGDENFGVLTRPNAINSTKFALEIGQKALAELNKFTGIDYSLSAEGMKMDQISIPDFAAGAMENWGLVTYRESALLYTESKTTTQDKQSIATVIAHELSHQWFGNLVTCDWWDYIWLNEGFATFFQYYTTEQVVQTLYHDSWSLMDQFVIKNLQASAFVADATTKTRPLNSQINSKTADQIQSLFDDIAYKKGASILRMLQVCLGEDVFQKGLQNYLNTNKFKSVKPKDLFDAIQKNVGVKKVLPNGKSLNEVMDNWLNKAGYPVVTVEKPTNSTDRVNLKQERFYLVKPAKQDTTQWYIPITYVTQEAPKDTKQLWMKPGAALVTVDVNNAQWVLFNKNQTGYYRVNYYPDNWKLLAKYLETENYKNISNTNRAQLIDDALNLAQAGYLSYDSALQITKYLNQEVDYIPWYAAVRAFDYLDRVLQGSEIHNKYHHYVAEKIQKFAKEANYTNPEEGSHVTKLSKVLALDAACKYEHEDCVNFAKGELKAWLETKEKKLSPDLRRGIICAGIRKGDADTWKKTFQKYQTSTDKEEQGDILSGLGCSTSETNVYELLNATIANNTKNIFSVMNSIAAGHAKSFDILLDFINKHIKEIKEIDENNEQLHAFLNKLAIKVTTDEQYSKLSVAAFTHLRELEKFTGLTQAVGNLAWIKTHRPIVQKWIVENYKEKGNEKEKEPNSASSFTLASFLMIIPVLLARFN